MSSSQFHPLLSHETPLQHNKKKTYTNNGNREKPQELKNQSKTQSFKFKKQKVSQFKYKDQWAKDFDSPHMQDVMILSRSEHALIN